MGFVPYGNELLVQWPVHMPTTLPEGEREWVEPPTQTDLDTLLAETPFAPVADRSGRLNRVFLPDHAHYVDAAASFVAHNFEDDPVMSLIQSEQVKRVAMLQTFAAEAAKGAVRYGGLYTLIPEGNLATQPSAALVGAPPGYAKPVMAVARGRLVREVIRAPEMLRSLGLMEKFEALHGKYTTDNHFYVYMICASPQLRGQGIGSILMNKIKPLCDLPQHSTEIYLENSKEKNLGFYHGKHMLQVYARPIIEAKSGNIAPVPLYIMKRLPNADPEGVPLVFEERALEEVSTTYTLNHK
ncbi:hypothetical protein KIPB_007687 [Kipferlia bialata]|uniref:N-acetyltransferase domain-containing protein n=1 Tax=Kipferlia bialata TaxID=797122 RepID=A0A9K3GK81_9EUKA|nr:hypothetical protein KIPB_007687 [Kipferlia bialata]|eukprot:g7687.t1